MSTLEHDAAGPGMTSAGTADAAAPTCEARHRVLIWDLPTRIFHWSLAGSFALAWLTSESERLQALHLLSGYTLLGLIAFRLVWGIAGSRHARFASFVRGPAAAFRYVGSLLRGQPEHHAGHNPAGALAIVLLLGLGLAAGLTGWASYNELGGEAVADGLEELHEALATGMLAVVIIHLAGVLVGSLAHRENLAAAMVTGRKLGISGEAIDRPRRIAALLLVAGLAGIWGTGLLASPAALPGLDLAAGSGGAGAEKDRGSGDGLNAKDAREARGGDDDDRGDSDRRRRDRDRDDD